MWVITAANVTLSDYVTMVEFMAKDFVAEAFTVYNHTQGTMQMCFLISEGKEIDVQTDWFPLYAVNYFDDNSGALDQPLSLEGCMLISMSGCDLIHTKNLRNTRSRIATRLTLTLPDEAVVVET